MWNLEQTCWNALLEITGVTNPRSYTFHSVKNNLGATSKIRKKEGKGRSCCLVHVKYSVGLAEELGKGRSKLSRILNVQPSPSRTLSIGLSHVSKSSFSSISRWKLKYQRDRAPWKVMDRRSSWIDWSFTLSFPSFSFFCFLNFVFEQPSAMNSNEYCPGWEKVWFYPDEICRTT